MLLAYQQSVGMVNDTEFSSENPKDFKKLKAEYEDLVQRYKRAVDNFDGESGKQENENIQEMYQELTQKHQQLVNMMKSEEIV